MHRRTPPTHRAESPHPNAQSINHASTRLDVSTRRAPQGSSRVPPVDWTHSHSGAVLPFAPHFALVVLGPDFGSALSLPERDSLVPRRHCLNCRLHGKLIIVISLIATEQMLFAT